MIEKLCTPSDDDHNEHKKLQLRELAALNGTLKEVTECYLCGMEGHTPETCPNKVSTQVGISVFAGLVMCFPAIVCCALRYRDHSTPGLLPRDAASSRVKLAVLPARRGPSPCLIQW